MNTKQITATLLTAIFLISALAVIAPMPTVNAQKELHVYGYGNTLHVADGATQWAEISIPVDIPIEEISELTFWEMIESYGANGWDVNIILGVDANNDGAFTADVAGWHIGSNAWTLTALNGDTFIEMDGPAKDPTTNVWKEINALTTAQWWTPDQSGAGFAKSDTYPWTFYGTFADLINVFIPDPTQTSLIPDTSVHVKVIKLVIGGSGSWVDETAYLSSLTINGETYYLTIQKAIDDAVEGGTILVHPGTYSENVVINVDQLTLESTTQYEANIQGHVRIEGDGVSVVGFKITDFTNYWGEYDGVWVFGQNAKVEDNLIDGTGIDPVANMVIGIQTLYGGTASADILNNQIVNVRMGIYIQAFNGGLFVVRGNTIEHTAWCAIGIDSDAGAEISGNTINDCKVGVEIFRGNVEITENAFAGGSTGMSLYDVTDVVVKYNDIVGHSDYGVNNLDAEIVDATLNWWGDPSGPYHATTNPDGKGDKVSDNVNYTAWLAHPKDWTPPPDPLVNTGTASGTNGLGEVVTDTDSWSIDIIATPTPVSTWPPEPYRPPVNLTEVRGNAETILSTLGEEPDNDHDGVVDIADAFDQLVDAGLLRTPSFTFDPDVASNMLTALESVYGANLVNFPSLEGRVWLLYMLTYLPSS